MHTPPPSSDLQPSAEFGYRPVGMNMWDPWFVEDQGQVHLFHLQRLSPGSKRSAWEADHIGRAVSHDLIHWAEQPLTVGPGEVGGLDDLQPWTGCVVVDQGLFHLFYTMRSSREDGRSQRIGLATSRDLVNWQRHPLNPIITPDARWYVHEGHPEPDNKVACRDLKVIRDPAGGWIGFFAATTPAAEEAEAACIAAARSKDLIHWEQLPPVFQPRRYGEVEAHDVFPLGGKWWMTCLTSHGHGSRGGFSDPHVVLGTIHAVADRPEGPYHEPSGDSILLGGDVTAGHTVCSVEFEGKRYALFQEGPRLSPPMEMNAAPDGRLRLMWSERQNAWRGASLLGPALPAPVDLRTHSSGGLTAGRWELAEDGSYRGKSRTGWQIGDLRVGAENVEVEASLVLGSGVAAGLAVRADRRSPHAAGDFVIGLDARDCCAFGAPLPLFFPMTRRTFRVEHGRTYHLRLFVRAERYELFIDDELVVHGAFPASFRRAVSAGSLNPAHQSEPNPIRGGGSSIGLFVDRGEVEIRDVAIYQQVLGPVAPEVSQPNHRYSHRAYQTEG